MVRPYIDSKGKPRLIEPPDEELKTVQSRMKTMLGEIRVPEYVFSGIKGRSYVDNARMHAMGTYLYKVDLAAFFPSTKRETVYRFFRRDLGCSPDVAEALTGFATIDLSRAATRDPEDVDLFLWGRGITVRNHLISGSPASQILSYLANHDMFDELHTLAVQNRATMTVYVDDITFSGSSPFSHWFRRRVEQIVSRYGYRVSKNKVKGYSRLYPKLVTGVIIGPRGKMTLKNSLRYSIVSEYNRLQLNPGDESIRKRLRGLLTAARQIDSQVFPSIYRYAYEEC